MRSPTWIIARQADNVVEAQRIAQAMENAGASVFSVSSDGYRRNVAQQRAHTCFVVWAKFQSPTTTAFIDRAILQEVGINSKEGGD